MLPLFALFMSRDAVARQFAYDAAFLDDVHPAARPHSRPRRRRAASASLRARIGNTLARPTWSPSH
jgi:hypothetical protein